jgi:RNA polymerase sigma-B factor
VEFNDDLVDDTPQGIELVARSEAWQRVQTMFQSIGTDEQRVLQMVVIDGMSLRQTARKLGISAMTVQRRVKSGLKSLASKLNEDQA